MKISPDPRKRLTNDPGAQYASPVSPRPDPLPSDEAKRAALAALDNTLSDRGASRALTAAYAIDMPRREAEVRAATVREVLQWLRRPQGMGGDSIRRMGDANAIAKEFGINGDVAL